MKKFLITGGAGFIGSAVIRNLIKHDDAKQKKVTVNSKEVALLNKIYSTIKE